MRYVIADKLKAAAFGISPDGHRTKNGKVILNEKEIGSVPGRTATAKLTAIGGTSYTASNLKRKLREEGWNE